MMSLFQSQNDVECKRHFDVFVWYFFDTILISVWSHSSVGLTSIWGQVEVILMAKWCHLTMSLRHKHVTSGWCHYFKVRNDIECKRHFDVIVWYFFDTILISVWSHSSVILTSIWGQVEVILMAKWCHLTMSLRHKQVTSGWCHYFKVKWCRM